MYIPNEYPSRQSFMNSQIYHLINPASPHFKKAKHNCLKNDYSLNRLVNHLRECEVINRLYVTTTVASWAVWAFDYLFGADNKDTLAVPIVMTSALIGQKILESIFTKGAIYLSGQCRVKYEVQRDLSNRIRLMIKDIALAQRDDCRKLAKMKVVELKQNLMKMTRYGDIIVECLDVDDDLNRLIEVAKKYSK